MFQLKKGNVVTMRDKFNTYLVLEANEQNAWLKCKQFKNEEDLGDGILCKELDQKILIPQFHAWQFNSSY